MIPAFVSSLVATGSIRRLAGLRKLKELLAEMGIKDILSEDWISISNANHVQQRRVDGNGRA